MGPSPEHRSPELFSAQPQKLSAHRQAALNYPWPQPSRVLDDPKAARALIPLPDHDAELHELAAHIATFALPANKEYSRLWQRQYAGTVSDPIAAVLQRLPRASAWTDDVQGALRVLPRFEVVFRIAAEYAGYTKIKEHEDYDALLVLAAWFCVRREHHPHGFLSAYPKALLCPLPHDLSPAQMGELSEAERQQFALRAPVYLRYLLLHLAGLKNCHELESGLHRSVLKSHGFKLISSEQVPEFTFPGITQGDDPAVRPWLLGRSGMFEGSAGRERLLQAGLWVVRCKEKVVQEDGPVWDLARMREIDWDATFKAEGVGSAKTWARFPEIRSWKGLLKAVMERVGYGTLIPSVTDEFLGRRTAVSLNSDAELWTKLDACSARVMERLRDTHPEFFASESPQTFVPDQARTFRQWTVLYDLESSNVLTEYGISAFHALQHVFPDWFGWSPEKLRPWEVEQENARWRGQRGRLLFRSAYAFSLLEAGLGRFEAGEERCYWVCSKAQFDSWYKTHVLLSERTPSELLYQMASRGKLTPLLNGELNPAEAVSVLVGKPVHANIPAWDKHRWAGCMNRSLNEHCGLLQVRLDLPPLPPLPLDVRDTLLGPVGMRYAHPHIAFVRPIDLKLMHDARLLRLEDIPGWFDDLRLIGTPLEEAMNREGSELRSLIESIADAVWNIKLAGQPRFSTLAKLLSSTLPGFEGTTTISLTDDQFRLLCRTARDEVLDWTNIVPASKDGVRRALTRLANREEVRALVQCAMTYVDSHRALSSESELGSFTCLDIIDDVLALTIKACAQYVIEQRGAQS